MHERSLVRALFAQLARLLREHEAARLSAVRVRVGEFSGVDAELFRLAFEDMVRMSPFGEVKLEVTTTELHARCRRCGHEFQVVGFHFCCPDCGDGQSEVVCGEELLLESVTFEEADRVEH